MLTPREGEVRLRADGQAKKPITASESEVGRGQWAGSDPPAEQETGRWGGWVGKGGQGGGRGGSLAAAQHSLIQAPHSPLSICGRRRCLLRTPLACCSLLAAKDSGRYGKRDRVRKIKRDSAKGD